MTRRRTLAVVASLALVGGLAAQPAGTATAAHSGLGMPTQAFYDGNGGQENSSTGGLWTDMVTPLALPHL